MTTIISNYHILNTYAVLASSGITTINTTTITNGVYGTPAGTGYRKYQSGQKGKYTIIHL